MNKIYHKKVSEIIYYDFWIRAEYNEDADGAIHVLMGEHPEIIEYNVSDSDGPDIYETEEMDENELYGWVKNRIVNAKDYIDCEED